MAKPWELNYDAAPAAAPARRALPPDADTKFAAQDEALGLPPGFTRAQLMVESGMNPQAVSPKGAQGLAQVMPPTRAAIERRVGRALDPSNLDDALTIHREVMGENLRRFGNAADAARAYNGGWNPARWGNPETAAYVPKIEAVRRGSGAMMPVSADGAPQFSSRAPKPWELQYDAQPAAQDDTLATAPEPEPPQAAPAPASQAAEPAPEPPPAPAPAAPQRSIVQQAVRGAGLFGRAALKAVASVPGMMSDAVTAPVNMAFLAAGKKAPFQPAGQAIDALADAIGLPAPENATERVVQDVAGAMGGAGASAALARQAAAGVSSAAGRAVAERMAAAPGAQLASAATGAGTAGVTREEGGGPVARVAAGLAGAMVPSAPSLAAAGVRRAVRGGEAGRQRMEQNIAAFEEAGVTPTVGQATEGRAARAVESVLSKTPGGAGVLARQAEEQAAGIGQRVEEIATAAAPQASAETTGRAIERGIKGEGGFIRRFKSRQAQLYDRLDAHLPGDAPVEVDRTRAALASLNEGIPEAPALSEWFKNAKIRGIEGALKDDMAGTPAVQSAILGADGQPLVSAPAAPARSTMPYESIKKLRSLVGRELDAPSLVADVPRAKWQALYAALSDDLEGAARAAGPQAARAWDRANRFTRAGMGRIERLEPIVNKDDPEAIFRAATSGTKEGASRLRAVMRSLLPHEQRQVAATLTRRLGVANPGQQNAAGDAFSAETFLTNLNRLSPDARRLIFGRLGDEAAPAQVDRLAQMASNMRDGSKVFANPSGTAGQITAQQMGLGALGALAMGQPGAAAAAAAAPVAANAAAKLMRNPRVVRWVARRSDAAPGLPGGAVGALSQIEPSGEAAEGAAPAALADAPLAAQPQDDSPGLPGEIAVPAMQPVVFSAPVDGAVDSAEPPAAAEPAASAEIAPPARRTPLDAQIERLGKRAAFIANQARADGGWTEQAAQERDRIEQTLIALQQRRTGAELVPSAPPASPPVAPAPVPAAAAEESGQTQPEEPPRGQEEGRGPTGLDSAVQAAVRQPDGADGFGADAGAGAGRGSPPGGVRAGAQARDARSPEGQPGADAVGRVALFAPAGITGVPLASSESAREAFRSSALQAPDQPAPDGGALAARGADRLPVGAGQGQAGPEAAPTAVAAAAQDGPAAPVDRLANEAATSPLNDRPEPSDAQKRAGNYRKGHVRVAGLDVSVENPAGSTRSGTGPDGKRWETQLAAHYGYVKRTRGADDDQVDLFIKPGTPEDHAGPVFVVDQRNRDGSFDEHKAVVGVRNGAEARRLYLANYEPGWKGLGAITRMEPDEFKAWLRSEETANPIAYRPNSARQRTSSKTGVGASATAPGEAAPPRANADEAVAPAQSSTAPDELKASPRDARLGALADAARWVKDAADRVRVPEAVPLVGGKGLGDLLVGGAARLLDDASYGSPPVRGKGWATRVDPGVVDLLAMSPVGIPGKIAGKAAAAAKSADDVAERIGAVVDERLAPEWFAARAKRARMDASAPESKGGLGLSARNTPEQRAAAMGYEGGWYRGGAAPALDTSKATLPTPATGQWYARDRSVAEEYARPHAVPDVREYAIPGKLLNLADDLSPDVARRAAAIVAERGGPKSEWLSRELRDLAGDAKQTMLPLYTGLAQNLGDDAAGEVLRAAGYSGVINASGHARVFSGVPVRDAKRAAFNPQAAKRDDIYGAIDPALLAILAGAATAGTGAAVLRDQSSGTSRRDSKPTAGR